MRIGCLQFAPVKGDVDNNLSRADAVLLKAETKDLDVLILPEMAFTGYNFTSLSDIYPHLEPSGSGISSLWARTTALRYECNVVCPYPERVQSSLKGGPGHPEYYNSAIIINSDGETVGHYRKSHLFTTDDAWASEGTQGFYHDVLPGLGSTAMGLSMDLNPYRFENPWHAFELSFHVLEIQANLLLISMAWPTNEDSGVFSQTPQEPDMDTLMYWVSRLEPIIRCERGEEVIIVLANRTGREDDVVYAGTSTVLGILDGEVRVYGLLGRSDKDLLVVDTNSPPYGILTYRPEGQNVKKDTPATFYTGESPMGPVAASWVPLPESPTRAAAVAQAILDSPRADSDTLGFAEELAKPRAAKHKIDAPVKQADPAPATPPRRAQPKLSLLTGEDVIKRPCDCDASARTTSSIFGSCSESTRSSHRIMNPAEAIMARRHVDSRIHRPTPHPFRSGASPGRLYKQAIAALRGEPASPAVGRGGAPFSAAVRSPSDHRHGRVFSPLSANTTASNFGSEGTLPSARSRRNSFDGHVLTMYTPGGSQTGSNVMSAKPKAGPTSATGLNQRISGNHSAVESNVAVPRPSSPKSRNISRAASRAGFKNQPGLSQDADANLDAVAQKLQDLALSSEDQHHEDAEPARQRASSQRPQRYQSRDPSRNGRSSSLLDDRRRTPSAAPVKRRPARSESQNGLQDLAVAQAGVTSSRTPSHARCDSCGRYDKRQESRPRDVPASATTAWAFAADTARFSSSRARDPSRGRPREPRTRVEEAKAPPGENRVKEKSRLRVQVDSTPVSKWVKQSTPPPASRDGASGNVVPPPDARQVQISRSPGQSSTSVALEAAKSIDLRRRNRSSSVSAGPRVDLSQFNMIEDVRDPSCPKHGDRGRRSESRHSRKHSGGSARSESRRNESRHSRKHSGGSGRSESRGPETIGTLPVGVGLGLHMPTSSGKGLGRRASAGDLRKAEEAYRRPKHRAQMSNCRPASPEIPDSASVYTRAPAQQKRVSHMRSRSVEQRPRKGPKMAPTPPEEPAMGRRGPLEGFRSPESFRGQESWVDMWMPPAPGPGHGTSGPRNGAGLSIYNLPTPGQSPV